MSTNKREATKLPTVKDNVAKDIEPEIAAVKKEDVQILSQLIGLVGVNRNNLAEDVELETVAGKKEDVKNITYSVNENKKNNKNNGNNENKKEEDAKIVKLDGCQVLKMGAQGSPT